MPSNPFTPGNGIEPKYLAGRIEMLFEEIANATNGYPYSLQFYGHFLIRKSRAASLGTADLQKLKPELVKALDTSFFDDRYAMASETEKRVLHTMAASPNKEVKTSEFKGFAYPTLMSSLQRLNEKGLIYSPQRGLHAFSLPLFKEYLLRKN